MLAPDLRLAWADFDSVFGERVVRVRRKIFVFHHIVGIAKTAQTVVCADDKQYVRSCRILSWPIFEQVGDRLCSWGSL